MIIGRDQIDFVESRARVASTDFVGITSVKTPMDQQVSSQVLTGNQYGPPAASCTLHIAHCLMHACHREQVGNAPPSSGAFLCCFAPPASGRDPPTTPEFNNLGQESTASASGRESDSGGASRAGGRWQIIWNKDRVAQRLVFEASGAT